MGELERKGKVEIIAGVQLLKGMEHRRELHHPAL